MTISRVISPQLPLRKDDQGMFFFDMPPGSVRLVTNDWNAWVGESPIIESQWDATADYVLVDEKSESNGIAGCRLTVPDDSECVEFLLHNRIRYGTEVVLSETRSFKVRIRYF
jgi:hypothetical protein